MYVTIKIRQEDYRKLLMIKAEKMLAEKRNVRISEIIAEIIDHYLKTAK